MRKSSARSARRSISKFGYLSRRFAPTITDPLYPAPREMVECPIIKVQTTGCEPTTDQVALLSDDCCWH
jgi:hypothetical protein